MRARLLEKSMANAMIWAVKVLPDEDEPTDSQFVGYP